MLPSSCPLTKLSLVKCNASKELCKHQEHSPAPLGARAAAGSAAQTQPESKAQTCQGSVSAWKSLCCAPKSAQESFQVHTVLPDWECSIPLSIFWLILVVSSTQSQVNMVVVVLPSHGEKKVLQLVRSLSALFRNLLKLILNYGNLFWVLIWAKSPKGPVCFIWLGLSIWEKGSDASLGWAVLCWYFRMMVEILAITGAQRNAAWECHVIDWKRG